MLENIKDNPELKKKFIEGLNKLGFPLEFKIRRRLKEKGYSAQEVFFVNKEAGQEITKSFDICADKNKDRIVMRNLTIRMELQLIGDCKFSNDPDKFLFAVPDTSSKLFVGPILTNFQSARYGVYRNSDLTNNFVSEFGDIFISSDIKDTSNNHVISGNSERDRKIDDHEKVFDIVEETILPAINKNFIFWRSQGYQNYLRGLKNFTRTMNVTEFIISQENEFYTGRLIIPIIVTSKPIIKPILNEKDEVIDIREISFTLYEHSIRKPDNYFEILGLCYNIGIFVCNEKFFDEFLTYIENIFNKISDEITNNLNQNPFRLIDDFEDIKRQNEEIQVVRNRNK